MDANRDVGALEGLSKIQISRSIEGRVASENNEDIDAASPHVGHQIFNRIGLAHWIGVDGIGVDDCLPDIAECLVHRVSKRVDNSWLVVSRDDDAGSAMSLKFSGNGADKLRLLAGPLAAIGVHADR